MKRRDSEQKHLYADEVFNSLKIFDIQGLLKEGNAYKCGIEVYQVPDFNSISFSGLNSEYEYARYSFCKQLSIPYYIIIVSESTRKYRRYKVEYSNSSLSYLLETELTENDFVKWWRDKQSFTQTKAMYNAKSRISESLIDNLLFANSLAWGVNIDGFSIDENTGKVNALYEKRICNTPRTVINYDPNTYFFYRGGDFPSWNILFELAKKMNVALILFTFDSVTVKGIGATRILNVNAQSGLSYKSNIKPFENLFTGNYAGLNLWLSQNL